ncbi:MAG: GNAT family N-acetyltransferase [Planctomycetes bacterium]|nr:GNAT family N-acetyltransferase [Planctomycetota bacterium]
MTENRGFRRGAVDFIVKAAPPKLELETPLGLVRIGPYELGDESSILELFREVFKVERSLDQWNWEFRDHPVGHHIFVGRLPDGKVVSQFTGLPVRAKVFERTTLFSQIVDSMVHPRCRGGLKKQGLFKLTLLAYCYHFGREDRELVQMGLPNPLAYRLGSQTCYYVPLTKCYAHMKELSEGEPVGDPEPEVKSQGETYRIDLLDRFPDDHDELWEKVKARHEIICYRDATYMNWRYVKNPHWDYRIVEVRSQDGGLRGLAVLRSWWLAQPDLVIAEWLVDDESPGAATALIKVAEHFARKDGMKRVLCVLNHNADESRVFEDQNYNLWQTQFRLVAHSYEPHIINEAQIGRHWYYTVGDFDVV